MTSVMGLFCRAGRTGLDLAIAKWIVERHGGEITPASVLGQGTKMMLRFPVLQRRG
ncbi:ATP-binding protein [Paenibacillus qinlingensis]|uniref:ATP-binding protein n=1 Tax=Paenibacillus qinlingensis TaxID=1837343 RepID=UPI00308246B0